MTPLAGQPQVAPEDNGTEQLPSGAALLVVKRGPNAGSRFLLDQIVTSAGRRPGSDIFLDEVTVSRRHAEFRMENGEFRVIDVGSLNGTYVNREPVESAVLANGDEIQIGKFRLVFLAAPRGVDSEGHTRGSNPNGGVVRGTRDPSACRSGRAASNGSPRCVDRGPAYSQDSRCSFTGADIDAGAEQEYAVGPR
jgi:pSer/pThr/pTyr-binding forkhead associated (FHA) protein